MTDLLTPVAARKDRSGGLRVFGGIQIALGILCAGMSYFVLVGRYISPGQRVDTALIYLPLAVALIALGAGSMRGKRWAVNLTLVGSAASLAGGLLVAPFLVWIVSRFVATEPSLSGGGAHVGCAVLAPVAFVLLVLTLLPLVYLLFYKRQDVRATVERLDPEPGWTDRQPLPLLVAAVFFASIPVGWLAALFRPIIPVPGAILTGNAARALALAVSVACAAIAWGLYRGMRGAWLAAVVLTVAGAAFWLWTLRDLDFVALLRATGAREEELAIMRRMDIRPGLFAMTAVSAAAWTAYLIWVRKFLLPRPGVSR